MIDSIDIHEFNRLLAEGQMLLLDVRRKTDYMADPRGIGGAAWRDPEEIDRWITELPPGRACLVYCVKGGSVSQSVAARMRREGHDAKLLEGGLKAWRESGNPLAAVRES
jgi:rhodanese-related sulfurtransferase